MIDICKTITDYDINLINRYRKSYAGYSNCSLCDIEKYLSFWKFNKENLFHRFGDKLMISKQVSFQKSTDELVSDYMTRTPDKVYAFPRAISRILDMVEIENSHEYENMWRWDLTRYLTDAIAIVENRVWPSCVASRPADAPRQWMILKNGDKIELTENMKITKLYKRLAKVYEIDGYEDFRLYHSQILNQKKTEGELVLSIHPMDYMTMSDNGCNWSSCMSWIEGGEFRQGTVEMMNSSMVIVAYLKAKTPFNCGLGEDVEWNSKKWRTLLILNDDILCSVKSYPYFNNELTKIALEFAKENLTSEGEFQDDYYLVNSGFVHSEEKLAEIVSQCSNEIKMFANKMVAVSAHTNMMYNDFGCADHFGFISKNVTDLCGGTYFNYSGESECVICGKEICGSNESSLSCYDDYDDCEEETFICPICGDTAYYDDGYWIEELNACVCYECYKDKYYFDCLQHRYIDLKNADEVLLLDEDGEILSSIKTDVSNSFIRNLYNFDSILHVYEPHIYNDKEAYFINIKDAPAHLRSDFYYNNDYEIVPFSMELRDKLLNLVKYQEDKDLTF